MSGGGQQCVIPYGSLRSVALQWVFHKKNYIYTPQVDPDMHVMTVYNDNNNNDNNVASVLYVYFAGVVINSSQSSQRVQIHLCFPSQTASAFQQQQTRRQKSRSAYSVVVVAPMPVVYICAKCREMWLNSLLTEFTEEESVGSD